MNPESGKKKKKSVEKISEPSLPKAPLSKEQIDSARDPLDVLVDKFPEMNVKELERKEKEKKMIDNLIKDILPEELK